MFVRQEVAGGDVMIVDLIDPQHSTPTKFAVAVEDMLRRRGAVDAALFEGLTRARPRLAKEIRAIAAECLAPSREGPGGGRPGWVLPALLSVAGTGVAGAIVIAIDDGEPPETAPTTQIAVVEALKPMPADAPEEPTTIPDKIIVVEEPALPKVLATPNPPGEATVLVLSVHELDPIILTAVSAETGESQRIALSRHRTAEATAFDIFKVWTLKGDQDLVRAFIDDEFML